ncbi:MAG: hypothetical protein L3J25_01060 [Flavobacteriaceae bacterium]|nr:hypothetical protein [Flavobacteriaceae bacterium]
MKNLGIWLDKEKAHIVTLEHGKEEFATIISNVENFRIGGGSGTRLKGGPQDVVQDSRYLEREKQQLKVYFKEIASQIKSADAIVIFGPAETYEKFKKELQTQYKSINAKVKDVIKADSMTNNQVKALVRDFFKSKS